ncbi:unnamed protein product [Discosporangium mesarthrocarpum]
MSALAVLTGLSGLSSLVFISFGQLLMMTSHRVGLSRWGVLFGSAPLVLGTAMCLGSILGAAGLSSPDGACRWSLAVSVWLAAPLSLGNFLSFLTFVTRRHNIFKLVEDNERGGPPPNVFRRWYDGIIWLCVALTVLEALRYRLGKRRLSVMAAEQGEGLGPDARGRSLLAGDIEEEREITLRERLLWERHCNHLRRACAERNEGLVSKARNSQEQGWTKPQ